MNEEVARLKNCLKRANDNHEHFEREWYLRGDEIERLKAQIVRLTTVLNAFVDKIDPACLVEDDLRHSDLADELRTALLILEGYDT